jgi:hypothetical protein
MLAYLPVCFLHFLWSRLGNATSLIEEVAVYIKGTTCINWRPKTDDDEFFVRFTGGSPG